MRETKPLPVHVNVAVLSTEAPEVPLPEVLTAYKIHQMRTSRAEADMKHIKAVKINDRECIRWKDLGAQILWLNRVWSKRLTWRLA